LFAKKAPIRKQIKLRQTRQSKVAIMQELPPNCGTCKQSKQIGGVYDKKSISIIHALALCLGLTVPAFAAGKTITAENYTIKIRDFIKETTHSVFYLGHDTDFEEVSVTV